jgi:hypothetical protein
MPDATDPTKHMERGRLRLRRVFGILMLAGLAYTYAPSLSHGLWPPTQPWGTLSLLLMAVLSWTPTRFKWAHRILSSCGLIALGIAFWSARQRLVEASAQHSSSAALPKPK